MNAPPAQRKRLAAILAADAVGYSRLMAHDEQATVAALDAARTVFRTTIAAHDGRVIDTAGDSVLAVFETAAGAVTAAIVAQQGLEALVEGLPADRRMRFRIGVHMGDVIEKADGTVYGDGVNIAARLEGLAQPGAITVSDAVHGAVRNRVAATFDDLGDQQVKNIADPVHAYSVRPHGLVGGEHRGGLAQSSSSWRFLRAFTWPRLASGLLVTALAGGMVAYLKLDRAHEGEAKSRPMSVGIMTFKSAPGADNEQYSSEFTHALMAMLARRLYTWNIASDHPNTGANAAREKMPASTAASPRYRVEGDVKRIEGRIAVDVQVIDSQTWSQLWGGRIEVNESRLIAFPELLLARTTNSIATVLSQAETQRVVRLPVGELGAMELVYRSSAVEINENFLSPNALREKLDLCETALRLEPNFVPAMVCKANVLTTPLDRIGAVMNQTVLDEADNLTTKAVSAAPNYASAWIVRADVLRFQNKWVAALEANSRAIQVDISRPSSLLWRASLMISAGEPEEVFALTERVLEIDPAAITYAELGRCEAFVALGQFDKAVMACERSASEDPHWSVHIALAVTYAHLGDMAKAAAARDKAISRQPKLTVATYRASRRIKADTPKQWEQHYKYWEPGLRMAGLREN
jgi:adenylate cyclase